MRACSYICVCVCLLVVSLRRVLCMNSRRVQSSWCVFYSCVRLLTVVLWYGRGLGDSATVTYSRDTYMYIHI